jgi:hypothetical protein
VALNIMEIILAGIRRCRLQPPMETAAGFEPAN